MRDIDPIQFDVSNDGAVALQTARDGRVPMMDSVTLCGRAAGPVQLDTIFGTANENVPSAEGMLFNQLPGAIRTAVDEWAMHLSARPWRFRREVMTHFAKVFANQFRRHMDEMTDEEFESLKEVGFTCLLERLDDGTRIANLHQARIYLDSVHDHHREAARRFLNSQTPRVLSHA
ncbi:MAG: hypothetical protein P1U88_16190 [Thalassobaculaceae bacterium]|nr:hypothetical protein [Thalassobaculaceae bacterium]